METQRWPKTGENRVGSQERSLATYQSGSLISTNDKDWHHKRVNYLCIYSSCILTDQTWVNWLLFIWAHSQRQFFATWEILDAEMEDGRQLWRLTATRYHVESIFYRLNVMIFHWELFIDDMNDWVVWFLGDELSLTEYKGEDHINLTANERRLL